VPVAFAVVSHVLFFGLFVGLAFLPFQRHVPWRERRRVLVPSPAPT
jgi:hypothetical protein